MIRIIINTYITRTDRSGNRYSVCSLRSTLTRKELWIDCGAGDGTSNISRMVREALGLPHGRTATISRTVTYKEYEALAKGELREHQTAECIEAIRALEQGLMPESRLHMSERQKAKRIVEAANILDDLGNHFDGPLADMARDFAALCESAVEESGDWVVGLNGRRSRAYAANGKVGKAIVAKREALGQRK